MASPNILTDTLLSKLSSQTQHIGTIADGLDLTLVLEKLVKFLEHDASHLLNEPMIREYKDQARDLLEKSRRSGSSIVIGLIGGTGVGKSTLINALAREEISHSSDRRPFTDRAVIYRHRDQDISFKRPSLLFKDPDATHLIDSIKDIVLIDMPDFDSYDRNNEKTVLELMPILDMAIWVVSPEKYADASFFDFVKNCHSHQNNFSFVFNKSDQLIDEDSIDRHLKLKEALGHFVFQLKAHTGIPNPRVFSVSSYWEFSGLSRDQFLDNEFSGLREFIMANRKAKEVQSIKFLNLHRQSTILFEEVLSKSQPDLKRRTIQRILDFREAHPGLDSFNFDEPTRKKISSDIFHLMAGGDRSLTSIQLAMKMFTLRLNKTDSVLPDGILSDLKKTLFSLGDPFINNMRQIHGRIGSESLLGLSETISENVPANFTSMVSESADQSVQSLTQILNATQNRISSFFLRSSQMFFLMLPVALLIVKLCTNEYVFRLFREVDAWGILWGLIVLASQIFSPQGLSSLLSLIVIELGLIVWLANRRIKKIRKRSSRLAELVLKDFQNSLEDGSKRVTKSVDANLGQISEALDELESLEKLFAVNA